MLLLTIIILIFSIIAQLWLGYYGFKGALGESLKAKKIFYALFWFSVILIFSFCFGLMRTQFLIWQEAGPPFQYLVPPYNEIWYFLQYSFTHFFFRYFISFSLSLFFFGFFFFINKKYQERFFEKEEPYIAALSIFVLPHPLCFVYLISVFLIGLISAAVKITKSRFSLYYIWLPLSLIVFLIGNR